jgi:hypothetical protein
MDKIEPPIAPLHEAAPTIPLVDRLQICAALWTEAHDPQATLSRLGKAVLNDGAFFDRLGKRGPTTETLDRFARFFADAGNWPEGAVPEEARAFAHVTGVSLNGATREATVSVAAGTGSPGKGDVVSPREKAA